MASDDSFDVSAHQTVMSSDVIAWIPDGSQYAEDIRPLIPKNSAFCIQGGQLTAALARQSVECHALGMFFAAQLLAFAAIERSIAGRLIYIKKLSLDNKEPISKLLDTAHKRGWLKHEEVSALNVLKDRRHDLLHLRPTPPNKDLVLSSRKNSKEALHLMLVPVFDSTSF